MIIIKDKTKCCGCEACVQICPHDCIAFTEDTEGFRYPKVDTEKCVNCGLCEKVCPVLNSGKPHDPMLIYAAKNLNEDDRYNSSSGGLFCLLAEKIIDSGGVVFGAKYDEQWNVVHGYTDTINGIKDFMTSKYVQSHIGESYIQVRDFLRNGRNVLFSGTPCQIAGLKRYLRKDYENLFLIEVLCHGVPSPKVWRLYLEEVMNNVRKDKNSVLLPPIHHTSESVPLCNHDNAQIKGISFRDKRTGWRKYSFALTLAKAVAEGKQNTVSFSQIHRENPYLMAFINNLILRPSCYKCRAKGGRSGADISLADFWSIGMVKREIDDDKGVTMVMIHSDKANQFLNNLNVQEYEIKGWDIWDICSIYYRSLICHPNRSRFFKIMRGNSTNISDRLDDYSQITPTYKVLMLIDRIRIRLRRLLGVRF